MRRLYETGATLREIGAEFGRDKKTVGRAIRRAGGVLRPARHVRRRQQSLGRCTHPEGCPRPAVSLVRGTLRACSLHRWRIYKRDGWGPIDRIQCGGQRLPQTCEHPHGCDRRAAGRRANRAWCAMHLGRIRNNGDPGEVAPRHRAVPDRCEHPDGCSRPAKSHLGDRAWCAMHLGRIRRVGDPGPACRLRARAGSGYLNPDGYRLFFDGPRKVAEHVLVMERLLGRRLRSGELVHHRNGVRGDNRPQNLELWVKPHPPGARVEDLVEWVAASYPDQVRRKLRDEDRGRQSAEG